MNRPHPHDRGRSPEGTVTVTVAFLHVMGLGTAIDWDEMDKFRHRRGARQIDWAAIDRARAARDGSP